MNNAACPSDAPLPGGASPEHPREAAPISHAAAAPFVRDHHYLGTLPKSVTRNYGLYEDGLLVAVACYGPVHSAKMPKTWIELRRLAKSFHCVMPLSQFLSQSLRALKADGIDAVLSWADMAMDHHGGIYQATNWIYTEPSSYNWNYSFRTESGVVDHRQAFKMFGTSSKSKVLALRPEWEAFLPPMKLRYLMPLCMRKRRCLEVLRTVERPYPKPGTEGMPKRIPHSRRREEGRR
jgi:hypothetical protein